MAIAKKTIRLLILEDSQNEAERLVSLFRNAGHATRVHRLTSSEDLAETGAARDAAVALAAERFGAVQR